MTEEKKMRHEIFSCCCTKTRNGLMHTHTHTPQIHACVTFRVIPSETIVETRNVAFGVTKQNNK